MHRCRQTLTEVEVRYFLRQLLLACEYLVQERVIHGDLKPGNLLLTEDLQLKVADFGLAARVNYEGELKKSTCGTPNYVAPEILTNKGHSYEADIWSVGCIMYKLLLGCPPFKASSRKETCARIRRNEYHIPSSVSSDASALIRWMLHPEPAKRPSVEAIMHHDFMTRGLLPARLPVSCLTTKPDLDKLNSGIDATDRKPLWEKNENCAAPACGFNSSPPTKLPTC
ncbi:serine/threonine-protein kinase PLK1-like [Amblyomma americanum]